MTPFNILQEARARAADATPGDLLDLCAARVKMLMGRPFASTDERLVNIAHYPSSPLYTETERLALEFTEQYVMDVAAMPDELVAALQECLGPEGLYSFTLGVYVVDQSERLQFSAVIHPEARIR